LMGKPERKHAHGRPKCGWENSIKMDLKDVEWGKAWIGLT